MENFQEEMELTPKAPQSQVALKESNQLSPPWSSPECSSEPVNIPQPTRVGLGIFLKNEEDIIKAALLRLELVENIVADIETRYISPIIFYLIWQ